MTESLIIAIAQINSSVGDIPGNCNRILASRVEASRGNAHLVVYPELVVVGYPPEDLVLKPSFLDAAENAVLRIAEATSDPGPALLISCPWRHEGKLYNAAILVHEGAVQAIRFKHKLPNYGVFDEVRIFEPGGLPEPVEFRGVQMGFMTCEDMWDHEVCEALAGKGAEILISLNGSPFELGKHELRTDLARARVAESGCPLIYTNLVGGQDELVFDGGSVVINADGKCAVQLPKWIERLEVTHWEKNHNTWVCTSNSCAEAQQGLEAVYNAMLLGLKDYVDKNGFPGVVLGLSGGIDSALSAVVAVDALGAERVRCVMLPSRYTSQESLEDAATCAELLGLDLAQIPINSIVDAYDLALRPFNESREPGVMEENIQARTRGVVLMAISNKLGHMVLTTGNKSEMSVGYATLYGDMCGGYSVLKDVYKSSVYELSRWRNSNRPAGALGAAGRVIPERIITKAPTAELRENQTDQDSLPPYDELDAILKRLVEEEQEVDEIVAAGFPRVVVQKVQQLLYNAEFKRRQSPPGVKITRKNFGRDRRYPITNHYLKP